MRVLYREQEVLHADRWCCTVQVSRAHSAPAEKAARQEWLQTAIRRLHDASINLADLLSLTQLSAQVDGPATSSQAPDWQGVCRAALHLLTTSDVGCISRKLRRYALIRLIIGSCTRGGKSAIAAQPNCSSNSQCTRRRVGHYSCGPPSTSESSINRTLLVMETFSG